VIGTTPWRFYFVGIDMIVVDVEVYRNYFLALFKDLGSGKYRSFEMYEGRALDIVLLKRVMASDTTISFNGLGYDLIILSAAIDGADCSKLKDLSDEIIKSNFPSWRVARDQGINVRPWDHIDVINVAPGQVSLKIYGGRMHAPTMQDLPIKPDELISPEQRADLKTYCKNDVDTTEMLYRKLEGVIDLRKKMSKQYAIDLRSKSDAQMAEAIIKHELEELTGKSYKAQKVDPGGVVRYASPGIVWFERQNLKDIYWRILKSGFVIRTNGSLRMPEWLSKTKIRIGETDYQMGIGGLHSCESKRAVVAAGDEALADFDVASYYPSIILKLELSPDKMGKDFLHVYQSIVTRRLEAKREMQRLEKEIKLLEKELAKVDKASSLVRQPNEVFDEK
jgi:DNA polymerase elongation subunit (family B)